MLKAAIIAGDARDEAAAGDRAGRDDERVRDVPPDRVVLDPHRSHLRHLDVRRTGGVEGEAEAVRADDGAGVFGVIEKVNAMPKQGVSSTFKFGTSFGFCQGMLVAAGIRFEFATPQKWQKSLDCRSGGDKAGTGFGPLTAPGPRIGSAPNGSDAGFPRAAV